MKVFRLRITDRKHESIGEQSQTFKDYESYKKVYETIVKLDQEIRDKLFKEGLKMCESSFQLLFYDKNEYKPGEIKKKKID